MAILTEERRYTPEDLLSMPEGDRFELVGGQLVERAMGTESSWIAGRLMLRVGMFNLEHGLGWDLPAETSFQCFPDDPVKVRRADGAFIVKGRLPGDRLPKGHCRVAPDLAVEVISPNDLFSDVQVKVQEYLRAGVRLVWVVDPEARLVEVFRADGSVSLLHAEDDLDGEQVLPGFRCPVADLFPPEVAESEITPQG